MARLSVNLNKIALLRNARRTGVPDIGHFARLAHAAGAHGLTVHPRPDERHIRRDDVFALAELMRGWRPGFELNIEGYPDKAFLDLVSVVRPEQCTLVPDAPGVLTSEEGWRLDETQLQIVQEASKTLRSIGSRAIVFVDAEPSIAQRARDAGAHGIEIYTGHYSAAFREGRPADCLAACAAAAEEAIKLGLVVNIGHDLNLENLPALVAAAPRISEASIGHELTVDALLMGWTAAITAYREALEIKH
ncbi:MULTISPECIES: pyridoxine 5'-phosphate synthase [unclassified Acidisoma]|jgi:pyridoxine 5-phosphate synthase|uniref:pyridoxine 5'-phosphate synthase n=1 Tax=unclassified Acidisoma TaxID=2634065 RepID=UPI00131ACE7C|nr:MULTISPECIES: pyridoxine 5'-phosphate synthase [unclassified Acidisoma]